MTTIYGGDEVNAIVVDIGSCLCKAGYAGDDVPKAVFPSVVGSVFERDGSSMDVDVSSTSAAATTADPSSSKRKLHVGHSAVNYRRDNMEIISPFSPDGQFADWEAIEALYSHALTDRLRLNPSEYAMMLAEPSHATGKVREKLAELLFEKFNVPALFLGRNAVLSSFATARQTSLVVDLGHQATTVSAVHDGYVLQKSIVRSPIAGQLLSHLMMRTAEARAIVAGTLLRPRYAFRKVDKPGGFEIEDVACPNTTDSFRRYQVEQIATDIKETICLLSGDRFDQDKNKNIPTVTYELPDGVEISVGPERFSVPEVFFQPALVQTHLGSEPYPGIDGALKSLPELIMECLNKSDVDVRKELYNGVILTGGSSLLPGLRDRIEKELQELGPQGGGVKLKLIAPANNIERRYSVWIGGSILASLGSFQQMWMSKKEFEEHGAQLIHRRAP